MKRTFFALILLSNLATQQVLAKPIYKNPPPSSLCINASDLGKRVETCGENQNFVRAAKQCYDKLEELRARVTKELKKEIDTISLQNQSASFDKSKRTYQEGQEAHEYVFHAGQTALKELDPYFDEVVYPEHAESDEEIMQTPCYHDAVVPMDEIAVAMKAIVVEAAGKAETAENHSDALKGHGTNLDTLTAPTNLSTDQKQNAAPRGKDIRKSDISGTKEKSKNK